MAKISKFTKLAIGISAAVGGMTILGSCGIANPNHVDFTKQTNLEADFVKNYLSDTGILTFDLQEFNAVKQNGANYAILTGVFVSSVTEGRENGFVTLSVSDDMFAVSEKIQPYEKQSGSSRDYADGFDARYAYGECSAIDAVKTILEDEATSLYYVKNTDKNLVIYDGATLSYNLDNGMGM